MNRDMTNRVGDLISFLDASPTPFHAVSECSRRLKDVGFRQLNEVDSWEIGVGDRAFVIRQDSSLIAFQVGLESPENAGFRIIGAHTDSPNLRVRPKPHLQGEGYSQLAIEPYGGVLLHTWLDRDLSLAGRVFFESEGTTNHALVNIARPILRVPSLAIHLDREVNKSGLKLNAEKHLFPIIGLDGCLSLDELLAKELQEKNRVTSLVTKIYSYDLMTYDSQLAALVGSDSDFICSGRLDNLSSCHAGLTALIDSSSEGGANATRVVALFDHEEVGSISSRGADGTFLETVLERILHASVQHSQQEFEKSIAQSFAISVDMSHGVHPNYPEKHDRNHRPVLGFGPVIKSNVNQAYATDSETSAMFLGICNDEDVRPQMFSSRNDLGCGSTIGSITSARLGIKTVDVGNSMLSMHSCREMASSRDVEPMIRVLHRFFESA